MQGKNAPGDEDSLRNVRVCIDCRIESPEVETNYTLISARHGWRLARTADAEGKLVMSWRCPTCWARFKKSTPP